MAFATFQNQNPEDQIQYYQNDFIEANLPQHSISNGSNWRIGSGEFLYNGYIDNFYILTDSLTKIKLEKLFFQSMQIIMMYPHSRELYQEKSLGINKYQVE